ncbi:hypothetical protein MPH_04410 [Macrophomina phaseolina MS6]|uniref:Uncharacterized protein n=2 Tax=Macrophomina phaseolina TaxID=35725 RepID=K2RU54_MACPH|nr:hypothetical protein MPH_04410 [Macrophomina phaseolina MS6]KAH7065397.1 hypothetical protein B0J12DRAFT_723400 [Macrophomina phaseolina]
MPIDWKSQESYQRLLAALVAANDNSIDYKKVAYYFGQGATYDSIEGRFRIAKRMANDLKREAEEEGRQMPTSRARSTTSTPRKPKAQRPTTATTANGESSQNSVQSGRIEKSTPSKRQRSLDDAAPGSSSGSGKGNSNKRAKLELEPQTPSSMEAPEDVEQRLSQDPFDKAFQHSFDDATLQRSFFFDDFDETAV